MAIPQPLAFPQHRADVCETEERDGEADLQFTSGPSSCLHVSAFHKTASHCFVCDLQHKQLHKIILALSSPASGAQWVSIDL